MRERTAFDAWLERSLVQEFGNAAREPIPDQMLALLESLCDAE